MSTEPLEKGIYPLSAGNSYPQNTSYSASPDKESGTSYSASSSPLLSPRQQEELKVVRDYIQRRSQGAVWESTTSQGLDIRDIESEFPLHVDFKAYLCEKA